MTTISKCLTVFALVACLAFLGVVSVSSMGGPNFEAHKSDPSLSGVFFTVTVNEETGVVTHSAETRRKLPTDPQNPNSDLAPKSIEKDSKVLGRVIIKARQYVKQDQQEREKAIDEQIVKRTAQIKEAKELLTIDKKAMDDRMASLDQLLKTTQKSLVDLEEAAVQSRTKTLAKEREAARRKQEIDRLRNQVEELIADQYRLSEQLGKLQNTLNQLDSFNATLKARRDSLIRQGAVSEGVNSTQPNTPGKET